MKRFCSIICNFICSHKQLCTLIYPVIYLIWWKALEDRSYTRYHEIHLAIDDLIPFNEYFIIPYLAWFAFIPAVFVFLFLKDHGKKEFYQYIVVLYSGMTFFLLFSTFYPNVQYLRPALFEHRNFFTDLVKMIYQSDTSTNVFPSIHVYNALAANMAICHSSIIRKHHKGIKLFSGILTLSIVLSTMFIKQHSVVDVLGGLTLAFIMEQLVYQRVFARDRKLEFRVRRG